jgi:predicted GIY-YIG superfamily endonuclease
MVDYANGKVYRLCIGGMTVYIGSTAQPLAARLAGHRRHKKSKFYGRGDVRIVLIEACPCANRDELRKREQYYIEHANALFPNVELRNEVRAYAPPETRKEYDAKYSKSEKRAASYERFYASDKGKASRAYWAEFMKCPGCRVSYRRNTKWNHERSKVHKKWEVLRATTQNLIETSTNPG